MSDRAPYAVDPAASRGRRCAEAESAHRSPFQRDRDRIIHSAAFRRLKHKTQVFVAHEGDHYRSRLTHTLEVAQIARTIARALRLDEDLAEAVALAHDLGHPPFGHAGERALDEAAAGFGGFDHNAQALRVVTRLERRYADFDGLNLSWETLEGLIKHNGPLLPDAGAPVASLPHGFRAYENVGELLLHTQASAEAQVAALADDIAYTNHDFDDGLRAGFFRPEDLRDLPVIGEAVRAVDARWPGLDAPRRQHEALRRLFGALVEDVLTESARRLDAAAPSNADAIRALPAPVIAFSPEMAAAITTLKRFLFGRMYRHFTVNRMMSKARGVVKELVAAFLAEPGLLPPEWRRDEGGGRERAVADYVAGMTDRYALDEHSRVLDPHARA